MFNSVSSDSCPESQDLSASNKIIMTWFLFVFFFLFLQKQKENHLNLGKVREIIKRYERMSEKQSTNIWQLF